MKKILLLCAIAIVLMAAQSCQKESPIRPNTAMLKVEKRSKITVLTPTSNDLYRDGESIIVTWKSENLPVGALITATVFYLNEKGEGVGAQLVPQEEVITAVKNTTLNDGEEVFTLPAINTLTFDGHTFPAQYGQHYQIDLQIVTLDKNGLWHEGNSYYEVRSEMFSIKAVLPAGCTTPYGYSVTTGQPCNK